MFVCLKYWLLLKLVSLVGRAGLETYARTLEKSCEGDITKLSAEVDQLIKCCMLGSSNILRNG